MRRIACYTITSLVLFSCAPCLAKPITTVLTLKEAKHFHGKVAAGLYVQADRFLRYSNANYYRRIVMADVQHPVRVVHRQGYYDVMVGPLRSVSDIRTVANQLKYDPALAAKKNSVTKALWSAQAPPPPVPVVPEQPKPVDPLAAEDSDDAGVSSDLTVFTGVPLLGDFSTGNWLVTAGGGASYANFGSSMSVNNNSGAPAPNNMDIYTTKSRTQPMIALLAGYRWVRPNPWLPAFSLNFSYQHLFSKSVGGTVIQYSDPDFTNYNYDWEVSSDVLMALLKVNLAEYWHVSPYLLGGMGAAFNRVSNYSEGALSGVTARTNPAFGSNAVTNFAYRLGGGVEYQIDPRILLSAEYQFQTIGNLASDRGTLAWSGQYLNLGSYQSSALLLNVTYLFDAVTG